MCNKIEILQLKSELERGKAGQAWDETASKVEGSDKSNITSRRWLDSCALRRKERYDETTKDSET